MPLRGVLTLDGVPLETQFLGVRVLFDGRAAACQNAISAAAQGRYEIQVASDAEVRGCGAPGAELLLWAFTDDGFIFSAQTALWPEDSTSAAFDARFWSEAPDGASTAVTEFKGHLFDRDGSDLPGGTVVEAFVSDVRCAVTSLRYGGANEGYYTLLVVGPDSIAGCPEGAQLTFRLDGKPAAETALNDLRRGSEGHELDLTVK